MKKLIDMPCIVYKFTVTFSIDFFNVLTILLQNLYVKLKIDISMS